MGGLNAREASLLPDALHAKAPERSWASKSTELFPYYVRYQRGRSGEIEQAVRAQGGQITHRIDMVDTLAILLPQAPQTGIAHLAAYKSGAIAVPLFTLFGPEALQFRLADSGARLLVTDAAGLAKVRALLPQLPALQRIYLAGDEATATAGATEATGAGGVEIAPLAAAIAAGSPGFAPVDTAEIL